MRQIRTHQIRRKKGETHARNINVQTEREEEFTKTSKQIGGITELQMHLSRNRSRDLIREN
jgi:hypothetical protein